MKFPIIQSSLIIVAFLLTAAGIPLLATPASDAIEAGNAARARNDPDSAIVKFSEVIRLDPSDPAGYYYRGGAYGQKGDTAKALSDFDTSIRLNPKSANAFQGRAVCYNLLGNYQQAVTDASEAIRLNPNDVINFTLRGGTYEKMGDHDRARADLDHAIELNPHFLFAYTLRSEVFEHIGNFPRASDDAAFAVGLTADSISAASALDQLAWILATAPDKAVRDGTKAVDLAKKACELTQWKDPAHIDTLAAAHAESGNFEQAIMWEKKCIELLPAGKKTTKFRARLALYQEGKPFRQQPKS